MSGIAGIVDFSGAPVPRELIERMTRSLAHRGPDGITHYVKGNVALGHCMLHTTTESLAERQPLVAPDISIALVMDGRLDNWQQLRTDLRLPHGNDAELVLAAYREWGDRFLSQLEGDFALAIWDARTHRLVCGRDIAGMRPFYYYTLGTCIAFASEVAAILAVPWVNTHLNEGMVSEWLANEWYSRDQTVWSGIRKLKPAHSLDASRDRCQTSRYWIPTLDKPITYATDDEYVEHYRDILVEATRRMSRSYCPLACEVSGGLDSSAVFAVAAQLHRAGRLLAPGLLGYTLDMSGTPADELEFSRAVQRHVGIRIEEIKPTFKNFAWYHAEAKRLRDLPGMPNGVMSTDLRNTAVRDGARVVLTGSGGDEWAGTQRNGMYYADLVSEREWSRLLQILSSDLRSLGIQVTIRMLLSNSMRSVLSVNMRHRLRSLFRRRRNPYWLTPVMLAQLRKQRMESDESLSVRPMRYSQTALLGTLNHPYTLHALEVEDRHSAGLAERRSPMWNRAYIQFAFSTSESLRERGRTYKWLHRQAMREFLPDDVLQRQDKSDFMCVFQKQISDSVAAMTTTVIPRRTDWVKPEAIRRMLCRIEGPEESSLEEWVIWCLVNMDAVDNSNCSPI